MFQRTFLSKAGFALALTGAIAIGASSVMAGEGKREGKHNKTLAGPGATTQPSEKGFSGDRKAGPLEWLRVTVLSLNPTEEQRAKIKGFAEDARKAHEAWRSAHQTELESFKSEMEAVRSTKDKEKLRALHEKGKALWASAPKPNDLLDKVRGVLTPEQQKQWDAAVQAKKDENKNFFDGPRPEGRSGKGGKGENETLKL